MPASQEDDTPHGAACEQVNHACLSAANLVYSSGAPKGTCGTLPFIPEEAELLVSNLDTSPFPPSGATRGTWTALRAIPRGAELLVSYLDTSSPENSAFLSAHARRHNPGTRLPEP